MKKLKNFVAVLTTCCVMGGLLAGCGGAKDAAKTEPAKNATPKVAIVLKTLANPFWVSMKDGIEAEAKKQGVQVDVFAVDSEEDVQGQLKKFEDALSKDYNAIGFAPISPVNLISAVAQASKKGMPVVNIDEKVDMKELKSAGGSVVAFVTTDNVKVGEKGAKYIIEKLGSAGGEVAVIEGKAGATSGEARRDGATAAFKANSAINLVASQPADWDRDKALNVATNLLQRYPNLKAFYCANDTMALGVLQAVQNSGKKDILVVGTDGAPEAVQSVKDGKLSATVAQDPAEIGATSLRLLVEALKNKNTGSPDKDPAFTAVDSKLIVK